MMWKFWVETLPRFQISQIDITHCKVYNRGTSHCTSINPCGIACATSTECLAAAAATRGANFFYDEAQ
jgi:hypothetical protein